MRVLWFWVRGQDQSASRAPRLHHKLWQKETMKKRHPARTIFCAGLALAVLFLSAPALFADELAPGYDACTAKAGSETAALQECNAAALTYWDRKLNENYKALKALCGYAGEADRGRCREALVRGQRAWITYRDAMKTVVYYRNGGGTLSSPLAARFLVAETRRQAEFLGNDMHNAEAQ